LFHHKLFKKTGLLIDITNKITDRKVADKKYKNRFEILNNELVKNRFSTKLINFEKRMILFYDGSQMGVGKVLAQTDNIQFLSSRDKKI
jgi:hypothetical protein